MSDTGRKKWDLWRHWTGRSKVRKYVGWGNRI